MLTQNKFANFCRKMANLDYDRAVKALDLAKNTKYSETRLRAMKMYHRAVAEHRKNSEKGGVEPRI